jgi:sec-independent protein translocase protein TatC
MTALRPIGHDVRLSVVDHLDELRRRLFVCGGVLFLAFCLCFWQNHPLINALNKALPSAHSVSEHDSLASQQNQSVKLHQAFRQIESSATQLQTALGQLHGAPAGAVQGAAGIASGAKLAVKSLPKVAPTKVLPITIGVGESFTTTLLVVGYFALLFSLPVILFQLYAFIIPALNPTEKRVALPAMIAAPVLFAAGALFTYFMILPPAVHFLQGYNSSDFDILVQAKTYYKFEMLMMLGIGLAFQVPLLLLALQRAGIITSSTLTVNWRYAVVLIAVIAAALPGVDPVTMFFETLPLVLLYLASIVMMKIVDRRTAKRQVAEVLAGIANSEAMGPVDAADPIDAADSADGSDTSDS